MFSRFTAGMVGVVLSTALASAQSMSVSGGAVLGAGDQVQITYENRARANGSVVIHIDNGEFPTPTFAEVIIQLDAQGKGTGTWVVPSWWTVHFNADGVREETRAVS